MKKGLVNIAQGTPEQLNKLKSFLLNSQVNFPEKCLRTHADAVVFAIEQAQKVPELEKEISTSEHDIIELSFECRDLKIENEGLKKRIEELEKNKGV